MEGSAVAELHSTNKKKFSNKIPTIENDPVSQSNPAIGRLPSLQVIRHVRHRLHASGQNNLLIPDSQALRRQHNRLHPRGAHLVHGRANCGLRQAGKNRGLSGRGLSDPALAHIAHENLFDGIFWHSGSFDSGLDCNGTQLGRREG